MDPTTTVAPLIKLHQKKWKNPGSKTIFPTSGHMSSLEMNKIQGHCSANEGKVANFNDTWVTILSAATDNSEIT